MKVALGMSIISRMKFPFYLTLTLLTGWSAQAQADTVITVGVASHGGAVILGGSVIPLKEVTLAAQMPGRVVSIAGEEGDEFAAGTELVKINDDDLQAKKSAVEAQLNSAQNAMQNAQVQYNRELWNPRVYNPRPMAGMGMPSMFDGFFNNMDNNSFMPGGSGGNKSIERHADLVTQGTQVASARSHVTEAESGLRAINAKLRDTKAVAPFDGVIMKKMVEIGDTVQPGQPLIVFSYSKFLRIQAEVPARLMPGLKKGMVVPARLDVGNTMINARVAQISPVADSQQHTVTVKFDLPEGVPGGPGMYAEVMIPDVSSPSRALPVVPMAAIHKKGSLPSVQVVDDEGNYKMRLVRIGEVVDENSVTILSGLKPGERILVRGRN
ncbi:MAG: CzcB/NccB family metal efflux transporter periplasmic adaptor subunit [Gammaproteobacteria bacterium]|nr:MAG: CzcB/NccB family metal efflux transporter periplasmic adaptor subunit [Gammaproteobacteria bacterium]